MPEEFIKGSPLQYNVGTQEKYLNQINRLLVDPLMKETEKEVNNLFDEFAAGLMAFGVLNTRARSILNKIDKKYGIIFKMQAEKIAKNYVKDINVYSKIGVKRNLKILSIGRTTAFKENKGNEEAIYNTGVNDLQLLIIGMYLFYLAKVRKQVSQAVLAKSGTVKPKPIKPGKPRKEDQEAEGIKDYLVRQRGITHRKTNNDLGKFYRGAYNSMNMESLKANGIKLWVWVHTNRAETQNLYHMNSLNGLTFRVGSPPPVIDQGTGTTGLPGDWYGCMCIMLPVALLL